jgi:RNA polymerase sigma factor (sigma-70 family)
MRGGSSGEVLRKLHTLYRFGVTGHQSDEQLLDRFVARRDETAEEAFAALVERHGPMVLGVCRRILGDAHEAEDAFQATFLVLARKANSVVRREKVASWLYGVAYRTARETLIRASRRRSREERVSKSPRVEPADPDSATELRAILDQELARLPVRYRGAVVLCELEGLSRQEAAERLGIPEGTLSSRLARGKAELRDRLKRHGLVVSFVALSATLGREASATILPARLIESTTRAAMCVAAGSSAAAVVSATVVSLTDGVLKAMLLAKLKTVVLGLGMMAAVVSGSLALAQTASPKDRAPSEDDRTTAMERKLDRIIDALDRMTGKSAATPNTVATLPRTTERITSQVDTTLATIAAAPSAANDLLMMSRLGDRSSDDATALLTQAKDAHNLPLADRMDAVERGLRTVQRRLEMLERRLAVLDQRVGGPTSASAAKLLRDHATQGLDLKEPDKPQEKRP